MNRNRAMMQGKFLDCTNPNTYMLLSAQSNLTSVVRDYTIALRIAFLGLLNLFKISGRLVQLSDLLQFVQGIDSARIYSDM